LTYVIVQTTIDLNSCNFYGYMGKKRVKNIKQRKENDRTKTSNRQIRIENDRTKTSNRQIMDRKRSNENEQSTTNDIEQRI